MDETMKAIVELWANRALHVKVIAKRRDVEEPVVGEHLKQLHSLGKIEAGVYVDELDYPIYVLRVRRAA